MDAEIKRTEIISGMLKASLNAFSGPLNTSSVPLGNSPENALPGEPIAIIGLSGYFPQCMDVHAFWEALDKDRSLIEEIPASRINWENIYDPLGKDPEKSHTKWGGIIPNIRDFDPEFFGILPGEAGLMDPRKRLLLMSVYHAMEDAGYAPGSFKSSKTGVFVAVEEDEYGGCMREVGVDPKNGNGGSSALIANQLSWFFDLRGPSEVINTMCSGAAVALHRAVHALRSGEVSCAIVGAANIMISADPFIFLSATGQMSSTDSVHSFGKDADGFLRSDGVASLILKPLSKAVHDGDAIYALIRNTAVNYNGKGGMSMAAPNISSHTDLIRSCYEQAGVDPRMVGYIEAQGMGNPVADIAEWEACNRALKAVAGGKGIQLGNGNCRVSTLKPILGHMHAASALGALFKIIRSFQTNTIHKISGLTEINPDLDIENQPCRLVTETEEWHGETFPRLAGLHSYGWGGNNAHLLIEEYKGERKTTPPSGQVIIPCSAGTEKQCRIIVQRLMEYMTQYPDQSLASIAYTMQTGRDAMKHRVVFAAATREDFIRQAGEYLEGKLPQGTSAGEGGVFAGEGVESTVKNAGQRLHLPGYPFDCREYWVDTNSIVLPKEMGSEAEIPRGKVNEAEFRRGADIPGKSDRGDRSDQGDRATRVLAMAERIVREVLSTFLLTPAAGIDLDRQFSDAGFDSLLVTKISFALRQKYGLEIAAAIFFEQTTPRELIRFISREFGDQLAASVEDRLTGESGARLAGGSEAAFSGQDRVRKDARDPGEERFPIAIIGVSGSFPQSPSIDRLWKNLVEGNNCIEEVPADRWPVADHFHPDKETANKAGKSYGKWGGFIEDFYHFDPLFFNISPLEAETMSPKERLFLQCAWHVLEDAGYTTQALSREAVGVFAGVTRGGIDPYKISPFTIPNRVSYVFNLNGPSMTIDTACSSSLIAIHEACHHIYSGQCSVALAGGVHVFLDPSHFAQLSGMYMLSPDGVSRSFGDKANGMVPGEGVGILMLKPLQRAIADRDHIYGVIRGSAINHGGKTNGFTVPNPRAHQDLIRSALEKAGLSAREISYVEAHGTGTPLGDPIEIRGLTEAFKKDTPDTQYCRLGSVKSNIGHLEAAAGVSGLVKILLQMKHRKLVPSLHSEELNSGIDFSKTPFVVQQEMEDWTPSDGNGKEIPRIACVSSFGAGGANAHVVVEEYVENPGQINTLQGASPAAIPTGDPFIVLLSAKNKDGLQEAAKRLSAYLRTSREPVHLPDLAYTLQVGRVALEERLAMEVWSLEDLGQKLEDFLGGNERIEHIYRGRINDNEETINLLLNDAEMSGIADGWAGSRNYSKLLTFWVKGLSFEWQKLYDMPSVGNPQPRRISLPGYPFRKDRFGLPEVAAWKPSLSDTGSIHAIHPLVQQNISTFLEQKFISEFTGQEFFLRDHVINGEKFLPGVAYLEMANVAMEMAAGSGQWGRQEEEGLNRPDFAVRLKNVAWIQPTIVRDESVQVHIRFYPGEDEEMGFEIGSGLAGQTGGDKVHSQGSAVLVERMTAPVADIDAIRNTPDHKIYSKAECYALFAGLGVAYGPAHTGIEQVYAGKEQVLARLKIPASVAGTLDRFCLHPSMMDAAFQSIMVLAMAGREKYKDGFPLAIPFALEELTVFGPCTENMWASIRMNEGAGLTGQLSDFDNLSFDIDLADDSGKVCVQMKKYTARVLRQGISHAAASGTILIRALREEEESSSTRETAVYGQKIVIACNGNRLAGEMAASGDAQVMTLQSSHSRIDERIRDYTIQLSGIVQDIFKSRPKDKVLLQLLVPGFGEEKLLAALYGLLKTAETENPKVSGHMINAENGRRMKIVLQEYLPGDKPGTTSGDKPGAISGNDSDAGGSNSDAGHPWKKDGVYLITGGMGGLGVIFAREILQQAPGATLILTGRSALDDDRKARIGALLKTGGSVVEYRQVDVSDNKAVDELVGSIRRQFGRINGIIHGAGVLNDGFILKKTGESIAAVLAPKVQGLVNLDLASRDLDMDIFILFSSSASLIGNVGQGDYAVANAFMDEYAQYRNALVAGGERRGHTIAINWPLWKDGGMKVDEQTEARMFATIGMSPMETASGLQALYQAILSGYGQMMIMYGDLRKLRNAFLNPSTGISEDLPSSIPGADKTVTGRADRSSVTDPAWNETLKGKAVFYFKNLLSKAIKLPEDRIDAVTPLENYGIDSIMVMQMTGELEKVLGSLPKTLFFEYRNITELTEYFIASHAERLHALLGLDNKVGAEEGHRFATDVALPGGKIKRLLHAGKPHPVERINPAKKINKGAAEPLDIAIIGLSGRYPEAKNLRRFWDNLRNGRNSVTEIPKERWDHSVYFDNDKGKRGKTYSKWGGFLDGVDEFDALFFNISPKEAELLDPQERLFLQCVYETVEDAGYTREGLGRPDGPGSGANVGVYVGVMWEEYHLYAAQETALGRPMALSSSPSSIANRVSYFFNFHGPSIAIDTMCSSSLTSIHLACQSLQKGECEAAIAGGVNVTVHPNKYLVLAHGRYASSKGLCESFGTGGDGYVPGEGVGAVLLKPLSKAIADNDHIYGVIKGTAVNHGGKVNGFSVPNPRAQASVIDKALKMAGFDGRTISYLEAHGTGTSLGDPIELAGLSKAFNTGEKKFCSIGSVKSNIGHCESAAGIAGVTKVLLQMKHGELVPSLHSKVLNANIDFENSPFIVQQELAEWKRPIAGPDGMEYPRRAGISSFGAGGTNAHIVIEEYIPEEWHRSSQRSPVPVHAGNPAAIILSARTEDRLKEQAIQLLSAIQHGLYEDKDLWNMAYTLQVGREGMEVRLAMEVASIKELEEKLACYIHGDTGTGNLYTGKAKGHKEILSFFSLDEDMDKTVESWVRKKKISKLLGLWVNGFEVVWDKLYTDPDLSYLPPRRISLPVYPFMQERHWPAMGHGKTGFGAAPGTFFGPALAPPSGTPSVMHPLVHRNTSTFAELKFSSVFTGEEFFLRDHLVNGEKLLPGVAYIEMVNEAMTKAGGQKRPSVQLENMVLAQPLHVNGHPEKVDIGLFPGENGEISFEIYGLSGNDEMKPVTYSQGIARYIEKVEPPVLDIGDLKGYQHVLDADTFYAMFSRMGIDYGPAQKAIETLYINESQVLARLSLPGVVAGTLDHYFLHPSLMDASLQAVAGFLANHYTGREEEIPLAVPFAIQAITVINRCTRDMWALVRYSNGDRDTTDTRQLSFDIDVCDATGNLCVQIQGLTVRTIRRKEGAIKKSLAADGTLLMEPYWKRKETVFSTRDIRYEHHLVVVIENEELAASISGQLAGVKVVVLHSSYPSIADNFESYAIQVFKEVKQLLASKSRNRILVQVLAPFRGEKQVFAGIAGLFKTARLENPLFTGQVIGVEHGDDDIISLLKNDSLDPNDTLIRYKEGNREVFSLREHVPGEMKGSHAWKDGGVYLITGGAGGLGLIFAEEIAGAVKNAAIILVGRSLLNAERESLLKDISSIGLNVEYRQADIADRNVAEALVQDILNTHGKLDGIIHSAGILRDNFILKKPAEEISDVLAPKIRGMVSLDLATAALPMDFFLACSSTAGITGSMGQADYAMANAFMDSYACYREGLVREGKRNGKTLSVNWPLWEKGGMHVTEEAGKSLLKNTGMMPMETEPGLKALYQAIGADSAQMMVMYGKLAKLRATILGDADPNKSEGAYLSDTMSDPGNGGYDRTDPRGAGSKKADDESMGIVGIERSEADRQGIQTGSYGKVEAAAYLKELLSEVIKLPAGQIDAGKPMEEYGIDSVMIMQMTGELEKVFGSLSKTLFFEYQTISELTDYLQDAFPEKFRSLPTVGKKAPVKKPVQSGHMPYVQPLIKSWAPSVRNNLSAETVIRPAERKILSDPLDIAVIGLAGRYPKARDLQAFWQVLKDGTNCITEIPKDRWDYERYFDRERHKSGKSYSKWGGFLDGVNEFDPLFFSISAGEAEILDPQERLFLQCAYETLEDAGYARGTAGYNKESGQTGNIGVYVGVMWDEYQLYGAQETALGRPMALSGIPASIANRVSYFCNFSGPSIAINTMCSSSLTAIHLACQSLQLGECDAALAGGVNVTLHPNKYMALGYGNFLSSKGLCESFGAGGDGYVPGEGVGAVLLKPLSAAIADNDHIYGVIKGSSLNHGGKTNGYTVPNPKAQANVIGRAMKMSGFDPGTISYLEAHGTGTSLGDPIEITGLSRAFGTKGNPFCSIGSVKSNIGHCESASGIAGLTKVLLQMKHRQLVPSLHSKILNPNIDFENSSFVVQQDLTEWKRPVVQTDGRAREYPRRAGVSSFGAGGSNAHLLLEEYLPENAKTSPENGKAYLPSAAAEPALIIMSARNEAQLKQQAERLVGWIKGLAYPTARMLKDVAYTLQIGREALKERMAFAVTSFPDLVERLEKYIEGEKTAHIYLGQVYNTGGVLNGADITGDKKIEDLIDKGDHAVLLESWVNGLNPDWSRLYVKDVNMESRPQRISLPTYPFARDHYWIPRIAGAGATEPASGAAGDGANVAGTASGSAGPQAGTADADMADIQSAPVKKTENIIMELLLEKTGHKLKALFAGIVKYSADQIDPREPLENYGIDSVMIVRLNKQLTEVYGELPATLFYEFQTLDALTSFLAKEHSDKSVEWTGIAVRDEHIQLSAIQSTLIQPTPVLNGKDKRNGKHIMESQKTFGGQNMQSNEPIAIIGMSGRYPKANNLDEYWENLRSGKDCISEIPGDRWSMDDFFQADPAVAASLGKSYGKWGGFIDGFAHFDPRFFNMTPREARATDPQIRLFMESCWQVLEDAGYTRQQLAESYNGNIGVFAGVTRAGFAFYAPELLKEGQYPLNTMSAVANRVSYILNLKGPSVPIDTMCSSSLTAIHEACESILRGRCEMAIAGGVNLLLHPSEYVILSANNFLSTDGRCRSFGAGGNGYVPGEGVGTVLLKPLSRAIADNDNIYAVIRGTSINHGGKTNGYTVPNPVAHSELIRSAFDHAGVNARDISYIEAHGTGTPLGDPIEITGLTKAFRSDTPDTQYCAIGSSKSNIGHLEASAGIAGIAKIVLQMKHKMLVPSLHAAELNPDINFGQSPFFVQQTLSEWKRPTREVNGSEKELPRIAGISSFGAGGSNAHIILEEYIPEDLGGKHSKLSVPASTHAIIPLSARNKERLKEYARELTGVIRQEQYTDLQLADIAYTLQTGREAMDERLALEVRSIAELVEKLEAFISGQQALEGLYVGSAKEHKETITLLAGDKDIAVAIDSWISAKKYGKLMGLWVKGLVIDWNGLYERDNDRPKRISLPGYPFDRKRYWISDKDQSADSPVRTTEPSIAAKDRSEKPADRMAPAPETQRNVLTPATQKNVPAPETPKNIPDQNAAAKMTSTAKVEEPFRLMTFEENWEEKAIEGAGNGGPMNGGSVNGNAIPAVKTLVCFVSGKDNQEAVKTAVKELSAETEVIFIFWSAEGMEEHADGSGSDAVGRSASDKTGRSGERYTISKKDDPETYRSVFNRIRSVHGEIDAMAYCWSLEDPSFIRDYYAIVAILQACISEKIKPKHILLTGQWEKQSDPSGMDRCYLESWIGFERSVKLILPGVRLKTVYQEAGDNTLDMKGWVNKIWMELNSMETGSTLYKEGKRWVYRIQPATIRPEANRLRAGGTYLVTGGMGSLGLLFARHLAEHYSANLILTGRAPMDLNKGSAIKDLESAGGRVFYLQADICDAAAMKEGLSLAKERFGHIHGIIHAAGILEAKMLPDKDPEGFFKVLAPKVEGTVLLDDLLKDEPLDFVCYFTSSSAIIGDFGACDYSIANRFQMAFARYRSGLEEQGFRKGKTIAINWPLWKDGGMDLNEEESTKMYLKSSGQRYLMTDEGIDMFVQLVSQGPVQQLVLAGQESRIRRFLGLQPVNGGQSGTLVPTEPAKGGDRPAATKPDAAQSTSKPDAAQSTGNSDAAQSAARPDIAQSAGAPDVAQSLEWDLVDLVSREQQIPKEELALQENLADLGFDSISLTRLALTLSHHFGVDITPAVFFEYPTIEKLKDYFLRGHMLVLEELYRK